MMYCITVNSTLAYAHKLPEKQIERPTAGKYQR
jgi:hypothetical protein